MGCRTVVWITTQFEGFHRWAAAPDDVGFLRHFHRHLFKVRAGIAVTGQDREVEFFQFKARVDKSLDRFRGQHFEASCEMIAQHVLETTGANFVEVSEDGENGAYVEFWDPPSSFKRTRCFVGTEAEGPLRGKRTLFIPGGVSVLNLERGILRAKIEGITYFYYGAGEDRMVNRGTFEYLRTCRPLATITVEVDHTPDWLCGLSQGLIVSRDPQDVSKANYIKTVGGGCIVWRSTIGSSEYVTSLQDPLFFQDQEVES